MIFDFDCNVGGRKLPNKGGLCQSLQVIPCNSNRLLWFYLLLRIFPPSFGVVRTWWSLFSVEKRLVEEVKSNDTLIVVGETGSGKTTRKIA